MNPPDKYDTEDPLFDTEHGVLKNKLGITDSDELDQAETDALVEAYRHAALSYSDDHQFTGKDIRSLHRLFLGKFFDWAGEYRTIDISSADIRWCHAQYIPKQMLEFGKLLEASTPFSPEWSRQEMLQKLAKIHGELVVIHPFRDGNGRVTRLLCDLLLLQAEKRPPHARGYYEQRPEYFAAIQQVWREAKYDKLITFLDSLILAPE